MGSAGIFEQLLQQVKHLAASIGSKVRSATDREQTAHSLQADDLLLDGRVGLREALNRFKTDLFMSSLTESSKYQSRVRGYGSHLTSAAIAMPMGTPEKRTKDRQSTRQSIKYILDQSEAAFLSALDLLAGNGRVEDVRQACLSIALLHAFQTSLGHGTSSVTAAAAGILGV